MRYDRKIPRHRIDSQAVRSVGYAGDDWVLQVEFTTGSVYNYYRVPPEEFASLMTAPSIGKHMNAQVKPYYEYEEVDEAFA